MSWHTLHYHFFFWENFPFFKRKKKFDHHFNYREKKRRRREERDKKVREKKIEKGRCVFIGLPFLLSVGMCISAVLRDSVEGENVLQVR